jgi:hypothetical protein
MHAPFSWGVGREVREEGGRDKDRKGGGGRRGKGEGGRDRDLGFGVWGVGLRSRV